MVGPDHIAIVERAAFLEYCCGVPRPEADARAIAEFCNTHVAATPPGVIGELIAADRRRRHADLQHDLAALGLVGCRTPEWGVASIVRDGRVYRPAAGGEPASPAIIAPAVANGLVQDLVAQDLATSQLRSRLDVAAVIGADEIELARIAGRPLLVFANVVSWLRSGTRGSVVIDWSRAGGDLDGIRAVLAPAHLAQRLHEATARCWPRPVIATPEKPASARNAA